MMIDPGVFTVDTMVEGAILLHLVNGNIIEFWEESAVINYLNLLNTTP